MILKLAGMKNGHLYVEEIEDIVSLSAEVRNGTKEFRIVTKDEQILYRSITDLWEIVAENASADDELVCKEDKPSINLEKAVATQKKNYEAIKNSKKNGDEDEPESRDEKEQELSYEMDL